MHLLNLNNANTWRTPVHESVPIGPLRLRLRTKDAMTARALVNEARLPVKRRGEWCEVEIPRVVYHEVVVLARR